MTNRIVERVKKDNERGARQQLIEELFYDFHRNRYQVYWMNFVRGVYFGFGTLLGSTVVVAIIIWLLSQFTNLFPSVGNVVQQLIDAIQHSK